MIDIGDYVDCFYSILEVINGFGNMKFLNEVLYDYVMIGNNEGIMLVKEYLNWFYDDVGFEVFVVNLFEKEGVCLLWVKFYKLYIMIDGIMIVFIGLIVVYLEFY